jgi:hypothetical protein
MLDTFGLTPRQQDIYNDMREEGLSMPDGKPVTPQWVKINYPSTQVQPRCKKRASPKTKRKKKVKK